MNKSDWTYKKLGEVCNILNGYAFKSTKYVNEGIRVIRIANVQKGVIVDEMPAFYPSSTEQEIKKYMLHEGDVLMSLTGNVGRVGILQKEMLPAALNQRVACLRFKEKNVSPRYIFHYLNSDLFEGLCIASARGIAQLNMSTDWLKEQHIPVPPLSIQQLIVEELDAIHSIIENKKQQVAELDNLAQSLFYQMFGDPITNPMGWEVKKLGEVGTFERGNGFLKKDFVEEGYPCIHYGQIHTKFGAYITKNLTFIPQDLVRKSKIAHSGDIIIAITSEDIDGSCKTIAWLGNYDVAVGAHAAIYRHNQNAMYLSYYTQTRAFYNEKEKYARGFKVMEIKPSDIAKIPIPLPPLSLQQSFAEKVEAIEAQKARIQESISETEKLLAQRMDNYFG